MKVFVIFGRFGNLGDMKLRPKMSLFRRRPHRPRRRGARIGAMIVPILVAINSVPAAADFRLCNNTSSRVGISVGYKEHEDWTTEGWTIEPIEDLLGFFLPCGGSFPDTSFQPTFDNMNHKPACNWGDTGRARTAGDITYDGQGHQGRITPEIIRVTDNWTGQSDHYTAGKSVLIELGNKKAKIVFDRTAGSKVEFRKTDGTTVEATDYSLQGLVKISAQVPAGTTGTITQVIATMTINGSLRTGLYTTPLVT